MFCHSCGKKIVEDSTYCKYCGKKQTDINSKNKKNIRTYCFCGKEFSDKKKLNFHEMYCSENPRNNKFPFNSSPRKAWFYFWITAILVFFATLYISINFANSNITLLSGKILLWFFIINIIIGVFAFLSTAILRDKPKNNHLSFFVKNILLICLIYLVINPVIFAVEGYRAVNDSEYAKKYQSNSISTHPTSIPTPTNIPTNTIKKNYSNPSSSATTNSTNVECIGPDGKNFFTSLNECKKLNEKWGKNVDYYTNCKMSENCGGSTKYIKYSECINGTCCQIGSNWIFYSSVDKCKTDQNNNNKNNNVAVTSTQNNSPKVAFNATETTIKGTYYCYDNKVNSMVTQQEFVKVLRESYEICTNSTTNKNEFSSCYQSNNCSNTTDSNCSQNCYNQAYSECNEDYQKYSTERSKLDTMRWSNCP